MKRRDFISCAAASSVCAMAPSAIAQEPAAKKRKTKNNCKITVLKKTLHSDLCQQYKGKPGQICTVLEEGQEFIVTSSPYRPPEGFCYWAWADIRAGILSVYFGREGALVTCCTDGFNPVIFKLEREA